MISISKGGGGLNLVFITIDSLSRNFLRCFGGDNATDGLAPIDVKTPNFDRLAARAAVFDAHWAGSLPCMPARREFFTGTQEFLWRPWGPIEPFDYPMARAARDVGVVTQLVTDHFHYFQHGSHGYFDDYHGIEYIRGHEVDQWKTSPRHPDPILMRQIKASGADDLTFLARAAYARNVHGFTQEEDFFAAKVFSAAAKWLDDNREHPHWLLVVDSFDVHEPFHCPEPYASMYTDEDPRDPSLINWPWYGRTDSGDSRLSPRQLAFIRSQFAGKITMVDTWLGRFLDRLDWDNTMLIVTTDHGHYVGEHGWIGKPVAPMYDALCRTPLFVWMPGGPLMGQRVTALTSAVDVYATVLDALGAAVPEHTHSRSLLPLLRGQTSRHRDWAVYGYWGSTVNVTDGRFTYLHPCRTDVDAYCYSTMMINPSDWFYPARPQPDATAGRFLPYTDTPVWRYGARSYTRHAEPLLFDVSVDPQQRQNLAGRGLADEVRMRNLLMTAMRELRAPAEQFERLALK